MVVTVKNRKGNKSRSLQGCTSLSDNTHVRCLRSEQLDHAETINMTTDSNNSHPLVHISGASIANTRRHTRSSQPDELIKPDK